MTILDKDIKEECKNDEACYSKCGFEVTETFMEEMANGKNVARCKMEISVHAI